jgi:hypothetical protein
VDNFVGKSALTTRKTAPGLQCDKTMKFSAEIIYLKSMRYNDFPSFPVVLRGHTAQDASSVEYYPSTLKVFCRV